MTTPARGTKPILGACDGCLSRRQFVVTATMAGAAAIVAACGNGQIGPDGIVAPGNPAGTTVKVGDFVGLASVDTLVKVGPALAVKRTAATTFAAYSMVCTHQGCLTQLQSNRFDCPCHGSQFDASGNVTRGPASRALAQYPTSYDPGTDILTIG